jgi:multicomponent Na+:H+ antiporter subunit B
MNMHSLILRATGHLILPLLLVFSIFLLLRGHNEPGGGFIGGLVAAAAIILYLFSMDIRAARKVLRVDPRDLIGAGMIIAVASAIPGALRGDAFFTAQWWAISLPGFGDVKLSTVLVFDIGVYLVVIGAVLTIMLALAEAED